MSQAFSLEPLVFRLSKKDIIELHNFLQRHATRDVRVAAKVYQYVDGFVCRDRYMHGSVTIIFDGNGVAAAEKEESPVEQPLTQVKTPAAPTPVGEICAKFMYGYSCCFRSDRKCGSIACKLHPRKLLLT